MDAIVPWQVLCKLILPHYPAGERGRPPVGVERMLCVYLLQQWFNLSDPAAEEALYDSAAMRAFVGIDLGREAAPDKTTICKFRHLLGAHDIGAAMLAAINVQLDEHGVTGQPWHHDGYNNPSMRSLRRSTRQARVTLRCTRPRRAISGMSA